MEEEVAIVTKRVGEIGAPRAPAEAAGRGNRARRHDLPRAARRRDARRQDQAEDAERLAIDRRSDLGRDRRPGPGGLFRRGAIGPGLAPNLVGAVVKDPVQDAVVLEEYLETVVRKRTG